jgi:glucose-6-phosphate 1-epimerase
VDTTDSSYGACEPLTLTAMDGAQLTACAHGGHVLGWTPAGGRPRLWLSPAARCGPGTAIRGGIPVIFPQFAGRGPLPKHGLARDRAWQVTTGADSTGSRGRDRSGARDGVSWRATLTDDDTTRQIWPHRFELRLEARATGGRLDTTLTLTNTGDGDLEFTAALHTYLALGSPEATLAGLGGRTAEDNARPGHIVTLEAPTLAPTRERDVAVLDATAPVVLDDPMLGRLTLTAEGFPDRVVWNPGSSHSLSDVRQGDEQGFVCVEAAALVSIVVTSGGVWNGRQTLRVGSS